jgi:hypothetical protein
MSLVMPHLMTEEEKQSVSDSFAEVLSKKEN